MAHGFSIYIRSTWLCKLHSFTFYLSLDLSSWILAAVAIDRFLAVTFVFSTRLGKLYPHPKVVCPVIALTLFFINLHLLLFVKSRKVEANRLANTSSMQFTPIFPGRNYFASAEMSNVQSIGVSHEYLYCVIDGSLNPAYMQFLLTYWPFIDLTIYAFLPFCIMTVCNVGIIKNAKLSNAIYESLRRRSDLARRRRNAIIVIKPEKSLSSLTNNSASAAMSKNFILNDVI